MRCAGLSRRATKIPASIVCRWQLARLTLSLACRKEMERDFLSAKTITDATDVLVGQRIKEAREKRGVSQAQLAERIGVTFQQLQKYEAATNRVSASRLKRVADALRFPVSYFLETGTIDEAWSRSGLDPDSLHFAEVLASIPSPMIRRRVAVFVEALREDLAAEEDRIRAALRAEIAQSASERKPGPKPGSKAPAKPKPPTA